ncbi:MAG: serine hydrolase domain-containing protein [Acidimicrobiales bacterium]
MKQVLAHIGLAVLEDLDRPLWNDITARHVLSHTSGLPNWRPEGEALVPIRPPGRRWGYSGEGFVLLQDAIERAAGRSIVELADELLLSPLEMGQTHFNDPEPGFHGYRTLLTTAADYARFLAHVLGIDDGRWVVQWPIDAGLAWGSGWGLELGPPDYCWQWGLNPGVSNFVIGCPASGDGVVVFTDDPNRGRAFYREVVQRELPGRHPSLEVETNPNFLRLVQ